MPDGKDQISSNSGLPEKNWQVDSVNPISGVPEKLDNLSNLMNAIVVVLLIGFAGMFVATIAIFVDAFRSKQTTYQSLVDKISAQQNTIDQMNQKMSVQVNQVPIPVRIVK